MIRMLLVATSLAIAGCAAFPEGRIVECKVPTSTAPRPGAALVGQTYGMEMTAIPLDAVQFTDATLLERVAVQHLSAARSAMDTVTVNARLVNCTDVPQVIGMRTSFMGESQAPTEQPSAWQTVHVRPRTTATYRENSISTNVRHYLIEVRQVR